MAEILNISFDTILIILDIAVLISIIKVIKKNDK